MLDKNIISVHLAVATATVACLTGVLAKTANAEQTPASLPVQSTEKTTPYATADDSGKSLRFLTTQRMTPMSATLDSPKTEAAVEVDSTKLGVTPATDESARAAAAVEAAKLKTNTANLLISDTAKPNLAQTTFEIERSTKRTDGWYIGVSGGLQNRERAGESVGTFFLFNTGYALNGFIGYRLGNVRLEGEIAKFNNPLRFLSNGGVGSAGVSNVTLRAYMANLSYDIPLKDSPIKPYVSGGIGFFQSTLNGVSSELLINNPQAFGGPQVINTTSDQPFAYQLKGGVSYVINPKTDVFIGYRYFHGGTLTLNTQFGTLKPSGGAVHNIEVGFRVNL